MLLWTVEKEKEDNLRKQNSAFKEETTNIFIDGRTSLSESAMNIIDKI